MENNSTIISTIPSESLDDQTTGLESWIDAQLLDIQPLVPAEIIAVKTASNGLYYYRVLPLLYDIDSKGQTQNNETIYNVPMTFVGNGNKFIDNIYKVGDKVTLAVCSKDIALIKYTWKKGSPQGYLPFKLNGAIIHGLLLAKKPTNYISLTEDDILTIRMLKKIILDTDGDINAKSNNFNVNSNEVNLGNNVRSGVLTEDSTLLLDPKTTLTLTPTSTSNVFEVAGAIKLTKGSGSASVKASFSPIGKKPNKENV
jgi:hypothetical protein